VKIGDRLRLSGDYDMYPEWLRGRSEYYARFITFLENNDERRSPAGRLSALIEFKEQKNLHDGWRVMCFMRW